VPEGVFPIPTSSSPSALPFMTTGALTRADASLLVAEMPVSVWPARNTVTRAGLVYDHDGECPLPFLDDVSEPNVRLLVAEWTYVVIEAVPHALVPHVALLLRRSRPAGS